MENKWKRTVFKLLVDIIIISLLIYLGFTIASLKLETEGLKQQVEFHRSSSEECWSAVNSHLKEADGRGWHRHGPEEQNGQP